MKKVVEALRRLVVSFNEIITSVPQENFDRETYLRAKRNYDHAVKTLEEIENDPDPNA